MGEGALCINERKNDSRNFIADAVDIASPSVVNITADMTVAKIFLGQSSGSGFVLNKEGFIVTNAHVVQKVPAGGNVYVTLWGERKRRLATVHSMDKATDLALVKLVDTPKDLPVAAIGKSDALRVGEFVVALGSLLLMNSVTAGIVSATARHGSELGMGGGNRTEYIQFDASINVGNSGGPLCNLDGAVVGVNVMKAQAEGIGFSIPIDLAMQTINQLINKRKAVRPYLGLKIINFIPTEMETRTKRKSRKDTILESSEDAQVLVMDVEAGSPAQLAGLKPGDIITNVNGKKIRGVRDFLGIIGFDDASQTLYLTINRQEQGFGHGGSKELQISVSTRKAG